MKSCIKEKWYHTTLSSFFSRKEDGSKVILNPLNKIPKTLPVWFPKNSLMTVRIKTGNGSESKNERVNV